MPTAPTDKDIFSPAEMRAAFAYDPITGKLTRLQDSACGPGKKGDVAGGVGNGGRVFVRYRGKRMLAHRVAWAIHYGRWPAAFVDHVNGDSLDNRLLNLREATHAENMRNRKTHAHSAIGVKGVARDGSGFRSSISLNGVRSRLGQFRSISEAFTAYEKAAVAMHGEFNSCTSRAASI